MAKIYLGSTNSQFVTANPSSIVIGASGSQSVLIDGVSNITIPNTVEDVDFLGAVSDYEFYQVPGTSTLEVYDLQGSQVAAIAVSGQTLSFSDGTANLGSSFSGGALAITLGGTTLTSTRAAVVPQTIDTNDIASATGTIGDNQANVYFEAGDNLYIVANNDIEVNAAAGEQSVYVKAGATNTVIPNTVENVEFGEGVGAYQFKQVSGSSMLDVLDAQGRTLAQISSANQTLKFSDGSATLASSFSGGSLGLSLGGADISTAAASVTPVSFDTSVTSGSGSPDSSTGDGAGNDNQTGADSVIANAQARSFENVTVSELASYDTQHVDSLSDVSAIWWGTDALTFGFPSTIVADHTDYGSATSDGWRALNSTEQGSFEGVVVSQNKFIARDVVEASDASSADIRLAAVDVLIDGSSFSFRSGVGIYGDIFVDNNGANNYQEDGYDAKALAKNLAYVMGLRLSLDESSDVNNIYYTVLSENMPGSYRLVGNSEDHSMHYENAFRTELGILDVAALQAMYGADMQTNAQDTVYVYNEAERKFEGADGYYKTIWDAGGEDTLDCSDAVYMCDINLSDYSLSTVSKRTILEEAIEVREAGEMPPIRFSDVHYNLLQLGEDGFYNENNLGIAKGVVIENVTTGQGNDTVTDNQVDNTIITGAGDDLIILGNGGFDIINGGSGSDTVRLSVASSDVETFSDETGFYIAANNFGAQLVGVEAIEYSDTTYMI